MTKFPSKADINKLHKQIARTLIDFISQESFKLWQQEDFRRLINFTKIDQTEQDRIFNELIVTSIGLLDLHIIDLLKQTSNKVEVTILKGVHKELLKDYPRLLIELGTPKHLAQNWDVLIKIRVKEYREDYDLATSEMEKWEELKKDPEYKFPLIRINTLSITSLQHIRRGKTSENDLLWRMLRKWITFMEATLSKLTSKFLTS